MLITLNPALDIACTIEQTDSASFFLQTTNSSFFFAVQTLVFLLDGCVMEVLGRDVLQLLLSSLQNKESCRELADKLSSTIDNLNPVKKLNKRSLDFNVVEFKLDVDNRSNFTSDKSFHGFRKQRDLFYQLMEQWSLSEPPSKDTTGKLYWLLSQVKSLATFDAFVRLFLDNLLLAGTKKLPPKSTNPQPTGA
uniref:Uncharacterized protein n=1 Tax=Ciona savignyi TaxID=51511 RepID=H2Z4U7_CIOSA